MLLFLALVLQLAAVLCLAQDDSSSSTGGAAAGPTVLPGSTASVTQYAVGNDCSDFQEQAWLELTRNTCMNDNEGGSVRVTCGSGVAPMFEQWSSNTQCAGPSSLNVTGVVSAAGPYDPLEPTGCLTSWGGEASFVIRCAEPAVSVARKTFFTDAACTVRTNLHTPSTTLGLSRLDLGVCYDGPQDSYASYLSADATRFMDYTFLGPNCSTAAFTNVDTFLLDTCMQEPPRKNAAQSSLGRKSGMSSMSTASSSSSSSTSRRLLSSASASSSSYFKVTGPSVASLRGAPAPTAWPPASENTLLFSWECGASDCLGTSTVPSGCRVRSAAKLGVCQPYDATTYSALLCAADTVVAAQGRFKDGACSKASALSYNVFKASNVCDQGTYYNCGQKTITQNLHP